MNRFQSTEIEPIMVRRAPNDRDRERAERIVQSDLDESSDEEKQRPSHTGAQARAHTILSTTNKGVGNTHSRAESRTHSRQASRSYIRHHTSSTRPPSRIHSRTHSRTIGKAKGKGKVMGKSQTRPPSRTHSRSQSLFIGGSISSLKHGRRSNYHTESSGDDDSDDDDEFRGGQCDSDDDGPPQFSRTLSTHTARDPNEAIPIHVNVFMLTHFKPNLTLEGGAVQSELSREGKAESRCLLQRMRGIIIDKVLVCPMEQCVESVYRFCRDSASIGSNLGYCPEWSLMPRMTSHAQLHELKAVLETGQVELSYLQDAKNYKYESVMDVPDSVEDAEQFEDRVRAFIAHMFEDYRSRARFDFGDDIIYSRNVLVCASSSVLRTFWNILSGDRVVDWQDAPGVLRLYAGDF